MQLSIIIVNYNVKHFVEQCLLSLSRATRGIEHEIFVVDNASVDGSVEHIRNRFPYVNLIENDRNVGFAKANNQALRKARGKYILLLNPDTVVQENTLVVSLEFMENHRDAGALTVKMIDGKGRYLPESKRGFPSPRTAFFKIFGFATLFPKSKLFARYYLGHLPENQTNEIEILPGAYMMIRKETLNITGLLDEDYFMYGEDIDLSYRIIRAGYKNYYLPKGQIIHYKGESTKKGSLNYLTLFYRAMIIFARKHLKSKAQAFILLIKLAIYLRALLSVITQLIRKGWLLLLDLALITGGSYFLTDLWEQVRFNSSDIYPDSYVLPLLCCYTVIWLCSLLSFGAYRFPQKRIATLQAIPVGTFAILIVYSLLPPEMRFSRALIFILTGWALAVTSLTRTLIGNLIPSLSLFNHGKGKRLAILGNAEEKERVKQILSLIGISYTYVNLPQSVLYSDRHTINLDRLADFIRINRITELIFCTQELSTEAIMEAMLHLSPWNINYKIAYREGSSIIGSNSIETRGELYTLDLKAIGKPGAKRAKRLFDLMLACIIIATFPIGVFLLRHPLDALTASFLVLTGQRTWIGYRGNRSADYEGLPRIRDGIFPFSTPENSSVSNKELNKMYARNYSVSIDFRAVLGKLFRFSGK